MVEKNGLRRETVILILLFAIFAAFQGSLQALVPLKMVSLGMSDSEIGLLQAVPGILAMAFGAPLARLATTRYRKAALAGIFLASILACLIYLVAETPAAMIPAQILFGASSPGFWALALFTSFQMVGDGNHNRLQGNIGVAQGIGFCTGPILGGFIGRSVINLGFFGGVGLGVLGFLGVMLLSPTPQLEEGEGLWRGFVGSYVRLFRVATRRPAVILAMALAMASGFIIQVYGGSFMLVHASGIGIATLVCTIAMGSRDLMAGVVRSWQSQAVERVGLVRLLFLSLGTALLITSLVPITTGPWGLGLVMVSSGAAIAFVIPGLNVLAGASSTLTEQAFGIVSTTIANFAAQLFFAPVTGVVLESIGYNAGYPLIGGAALLALLAVYLWSRRAVPRSAGKATE